MTTDTCQWCNHRIRLNSRGRWVRLADPYCPDAPNHEHSPAN